jgi:hypothetical protein
MGRLLGSWRLDTSGLHYSGPRCRSLSLLRTGGCPYPSWGHWGEVKNILWKTLLNAWNISTAIAGATGSIKANAIDTFNI